MDSIIRIGHPIAFGALFIISLIELSISSWITAKYNANHNFPTSAARARVRYLLFASIWTILFGSVSLVGFLVAPTRIFTSVASHFVFLFLTWILWLAAAAAITQTLGGGLNCYVQSYFVYCSQLNALEGFAWLIWVVLTLTLLVVLIRGIQAVKRGGRFPGGVIEA